MSTNNYPNRFLRLRKTGRIVELPSISAKATKLGMRAIPKNGNVSTSILTRIRGNYFLINSDTPQLSIPKEAKLVWMLTALDGSRLILWEIT